jgi:hypothetical protein
MNSKKTSLFLISFLFAAFFLLSCNQGNQQNKAAGSSDTTLVQKDSAPVNAPSEDTSAKQESKKKDDTSTITNADLPKVLIYNFHITNRCVSCIAIEKATTKTLNTYFASEVKQGRIKRYILNVDDAINKNISFKYQAFGSGCFVTRVYKGKETTTDFTGDGFKYAKNKEEKFIALLKNKISEYLK